MKPSALHLVPLVIVLAMAGCGQDVVINVDELPTGNALGTSASGEFSYVEVVTDTSCPTTAAGIALPALGDTWTTTATLTQADGYFLMEVDGGSGRPSFMIDGGIFWYGNFRIGGTYYFSAPAETLTFINLSDGRFLEQCVDSYKGTTRIRVTASDADCEIVVAYTGDRV